MPTNLPTPNKGDKFGKLIFISEAGKSEDGYRLWKMKCDCGNLFTNNAYSIKSLKTQSCGCRKYKIKNDYTGQKFGLITVISFSHQDDKYRTYWNCICECNPNRIICMREPYNKRGHKLEKSCGCLFAEFNKTRKGPKNNKWNPNLTDKERNDNRDISENTKWRKEVFERDNYTCQICKDNQGGNLIAHHLESYTDYAELRFELSNGICLCKHCHLEFHKIYGYKHNTARQFNQYLKEKNDAEINALYNDFIWLSS